MKLGGGLGAKVYGAVVVQHDYIHTLHYQTGLIGVPESARYIILKLITNMALCRM